MPERMPIDDLARDARLDAVANAADLGVERWRYQDEEVIVAEGDSARELYVLEEGSVRVERADPASGTGRYLAMVTAEPGRMQAFGEMAYFLDGSRTATVRSIGGSIVLKVESRSIPLLFHRCPELVRELFAGLVDKLRQTTAELRGLQDLFALRAEQRFVTPETSLLHDVGETPAWLHRVVSGQVTLEDPEGDTVVVRPSGPTDGFVDPGPFLAGRPATRRARAVPGSILISVPRASALAAVRSFPETIVGLMREIEASRSGPGP